MKEHCITNDGTIYPEWHNKPLRLTVQEIDSPFSVFYSFFDWASIVSVRQKLKAWWESALINEFGYRAENRPLYEHIEKLMEAAWILNQGEKSRDTEAINEEAKEEDAGEKDVFMPEDDLDDELDLELCFLDYIDSDTLPCLFEIFKYSCDYSSIKKALYTWVKLAVCSERENRYYEGEDRARLFTFCENLQHLIEALYVLMVAWSEDNEVEELKLSLMEHYLYLNDKEQYNPFIVIEAFRHNFPIKYARAELWNLLDAVISYKGPEQVKWGNIMWDYEILLCMVEAAYLLNKEDKALSQALEKLQTKSRKTPED